MCGIFAVLNLQNAPAFRERALELQRKLRHRGPDASGLHICGSTTTVNTSNSESTTATAEISESAAVNCLITTSSANSLGVMNQAILCHERLAIVDPDSADQPLFSTRSMSMSSSSNSNSSKVVLICVGEIYNHNELKACLRKEAEERREDCYKYSTEGDCEVLLALYERYGAEGFLREGPEVKGMFSCVIVDTRGSKLEFLVARDHAGIIPLYFGETDDPTAQAGAEGRAYWVSSEMKSLVQDCGSFDEFPAGSIYLSKHKEFYPFAAHPAAVTDVDKSLSEGPLLFPAPTDFEEFRKLKSSENGGGKTSIADHRISPEEIKDSLEAAVKSHLMSDVPYGVLLSGGLDSSLVASIMAKYCRKRQEDETGESEAHWPRLHSFCIGLKGSPDLEAAKKVADYLGTVHHPYTFTAQQGIDALPEVIQHIETFDVTTIRASTPMFLMCRKIRALGVKMVLSGEGADELFGGYLYFHKAPNRAKFYEETVRKVRQLPKYDCLRANKSMMAFSVEARVPFLDREFIAKAFSFDPAQKMCVYDSDDEDLYGSELGIKKGDKRTEKWILRKAFDCKQDPSDPGSKDYLPKEVLWRQKEQFSDGVGYNWIDGIKEHAERVISDAEFSAAKYLYPEKTPSTKEAFLYRKIFEEKFCRNEKPGSYASNSAGKTSAIKCVAWQDSIACSSAAALEWDPSFKHNADASGRAVMDVHEQGKQCTESPTESKRTTRKSKSGLATESDNSPQKKTRSSRKSGTLGTALTTGVITADAISTGTQQLQNELINSAVENTRWLVSGIDSIAEAASLKGVFGGGGTLAATETSEEATVSGNVSEEAGPKTGGQEGKVSVSSTGDSSEGENFPVATEGGNTNGRKNIPSMIVEGDEEEEKKEEKEWVEVQRVSSEE